MAGDPRGFDYALEPVRKRRQWQLDAGLARLGNLRRRISEWEAKRDQVHNECTVQAARAAEMWTARPDPGAQAGLLEHLATLQQSRADAEHEIAALTQSLEKALQECVAQQLKLQVLDEHRAGAVKAYATEQHRKAGAQADRDWSARSHSSSGGPA